MKAYRRIVVAVDFSPGSRSAIGAVEALAGKERLTVYLTHVIEPPAFVLPRSALVVYDGSYRDEARRRLQVLAAALTRRLGKAVDVRVELRQGPSEVQICNLADRVRAHLIIVGSHGRSGFRHALLGSVAERVARFAKRPVLIVPLAAAHRPRR